jgi:peptidyl-prolyl cis-trans isomerase B (cyclophilin B)
MTAVSRRSLAASGILLLAGLALLAGCGSNKKAAAEVDGCTVVTAPKGAPHNETKPTALLPAGKHYDITFQTNCGNFTIRIDQAQSPNTAASFVSLVQHEFFDNTIFHRIVTGFMVQGGDPTGTGEGGPGYETVDTPPANAAYTSGVVAMAKTGTEPAGTAGSQFFIVDEANAGLPADYAIIGKVTQGMDVVDTIGRHGAATEEGTPSMVIEIEHATVKVS